MEVKGHGQYAVLVWLKSSDLEIFPISFSKYGTYYRQNMNHLFGEGVLDA